MCTRCGVQCSVSWKKYSTHDAEREVEVEVQVVHFLPSVRPPV